MEKNCYKKFSGGLQEYYKMNVIHLRVGNFCNEIVLIKQYNVPNFDKKFIMKNSDLNLNTIQTIYDFGNFTKSQIKTLNFYLSDSKYKNKFEKIRKDEKVVLDLKNNINLFLNETKTECNISFFYHRSSELIDIMIEYYDLLNRYDELFNAILFKTQKSKSRNAESLAV